MNSQPYSGIVGPGSKKLKDNFFLGLAQTTDHGCFCSDFRSSGRQVAQLRSSNCEIIQSDTTEINSCCLGLSGATGELVGIHRSKIAINFLRIRFLMTGKPASQICHFLATPASFGDSFSYFFQMFVSTQVNKQLSDKGMKFVQTTSDGSKASNGASRLASALGVFLVLMNSPSPQTCEIPKSC